MEIFPLLLTIVTKSSIFNVGRGPENTSSNFAYWSIRLNSSQKILKTLNQLLIKHLWRSSFLKKLKVFWSAALRKINASTNICGLFAYFLGTPCNGCFPIKCCNLIFAGLANFDHIWQNQSLQTIIKNSLRFLIKSKVSIKFYGVCFVNDSKTSFKKCKISWKHSEAATIGVLQKSYPQKFLNIHRKPPALESLFNKV